MDSLHSAINRAVTTINNCEDEPIHIPGSIQPYGYLLIIDPLSGLIDMCSENIADFLLASPAYILSKNFDSILPAPLIEAVKQYTATDYTREDHLPLPVSLHGKNFDCFIKNSGSYLCIECVPAPENLYSIYDLFLRTNRLLGLTDQATNLYKLCNLVTEQVRSIMGYDRVMVYRFDENYNGHVFAESIAEGTESFLNLHYPHTDIPIQARELYLKNLIRLIPDVNYSPVALVSLKPELARPETLDLSQASLRSVSPIHIKYLQNMGVGATFTISLLKDGRLWGLIACHHQKAKLLPYSKQVQAYLLSQILSSQIGVQETAEKYELLQQLQVPFNTLAGLLEREENFIELHFENNKDLCKVAGATGAALIYKNQIYRNGLTPPDHFIYELQRWINTYGHSGFYTNELSAKFKEAAQYKDSASGLLYYQLNISDQPSLFWFRTAVNKVITWAGNPYEQKAISPLTPRSSFAAWEQMIEGKSEAFLQPELETAFRLSYLLQRHIFHLYQREDELRNRKLKEQFLKANKELENINWISTHDLQEPLRKIQIFASMIDAPNGLDDVNNLRQSFVRIRAAANRMQQFIEDLLVYSKMSNVDQAYEEVDMNKVLDEVLGDFKEEKENELFVIKSDHLPTIKASKFQMHQLLINLIGNSIKFKKDDEQQQLVISYSEVINTGINGDENLRWDLITISDSGIGFDVNMANSIFDIFKRGHSEEKFGGTGVGLSICRKIMENHGGKIIADAKEGAGADFKLYFPKN